MRVFITGISGMDGSYLADHLLGKGHEICGMVRRNSVSENQSYRINHIFDKIRLEYGDLTDQSSLENILTDFRPDYIYNLGAQSHVKVSFSVPQFTLQTNTMGVLNLLEAYRRLCPEARMYQASSSEEFGLAVDDDKFQRETTPFIPVSPYGVSKVASYYLVAHYRRAYGLHASNGILFNHTGPRRGLNFVEQKVCRAVARIKLGLQTTLELGNLDSYRDFGHSKDYVRAMEMIVNHPTAGDYVVATGEAHSIRELCEEAFSYVNLNYRDHVVQNPKYLRPEELPYLRGDSAKIRECLGWTPEYTFEAIIREMIDYWLNEFSKNNNSQTPTR